VTASLPCYLEDNVDRQRGDGVFKSSIAALRRLNTLGYGVATSDRVLNLVYNPVGPTLPPDQVELEQAYKEQLAARYGIVFNQLLALANMPIKRFGSQLVSNNQFHDYMQLLKDAHQDANLDGVMCRSLISVSWQGHVFDCDFNQMLGLPLGGDAAGPVHLSQLLAEDWDGRAIRVADHCYGCTAGQGSTPLKFGVGLFQPDRDKNDATYRPLAAYLEQRLGRKVELRTVDSWEGLAKSLANGETDIALMGPWGYVLANNEAGAQVVSTILYDGKPEYYAIMITHPDSGIRSPADLKGRSFAFGDKGSTSGYLIPLHYFMTQGIDPEKHFSRVLHTRHQAIETQVTQGALDAGADYNRNRNAMIEQGLIRAERSVVFWQSAPLPNDAFAVSRAARATRPSSPACNRRWQASARR
jgi:phosphonate transport system substrate-binding protein